MVHLELRRRTHGFEALAGQGYEPEYSVSSWVSVLLVVLFHAEFSWASFGYIGVDVFFLLSGFLTPIILDKYDAFSYARARIRRLFPALIAVISVCAIAGYVLMMPSEFSEFATSALLAMLGLSQFYFMRNTGYFDIDAGLQPLLHTWSLGNEFVAYLIVFLVLLLMGRAMAKTSFVVLSGVFGIITVYLVFGDVKYFSPIPRLFLFFLAGAVSFYRNRLTVPDYVYLVVSGVSLVAMGLLFGQQIGSKLWPNPAIILLPLIILPFLLCKRDIFGRGLFAKTFSSLGDWSYSIYLWPIIVFEKIYLRSPFIGSKEAIVLVGLSLIVGIASFYGIERQRRLSV